MTTRLDDIQHWGGKAAWLLASGALFAFPALLLPLPSKANGAFTVLLLWSAGCMAAAAVSGGRPWSPRLKSCWPLALAMAALPVVVACNQLAGDDGQIDVPYLYLRFALFGLLVWGMIRLGSRMLQKVWWSFAAGAIAAAVWLHVATQESARPMHVGVFNIIPFSDLALLMGVLACASIGWSPPGHRFEIGVKALAGVAGVYASYLSGTRGGWVALPVLLLVASLAHRRWSWRQRGAALAVALVAAITIGVSSDGVRKRVEQGMADLSRYEQGMRDTSVGIRLQLWSASLRMLEQNPLTGVGIDEFRDTVREQARQGLVTSEAAAFDHAHNDIFYIMATLGVPGVLAILALYLAPAWFFIRHLRHADPRVSVAAVMGLCVCAGFFMFGMTEAMFAIAMTNAFYVLTLAVLTAFILACQGEPAGAREDQAPRLAA